MSYVTKDVVTITAGADGNATAYSSVLTGKIDAIVYTKDDFAAGVDFVITVEGTGQGLWSEENVNASTFRVPRQAVHSVLGVAATYDGTRPILEPVAIANDRVKIVVSHGAAGSGSGSGSGSDAIVGAGTTGTFTIIVA